jgi:hypothetical protein
MAGSVVAVGAADAVAGAAVGTPVSIAVGAGATAGAAEHAATTASNALEHPRSSPLAGIGPPMDHYAQSTSNLSGTAGMRNVDP